MNNIKGSVLPLTIVFLTVVSITSIISIQANLLETKIINNIEKKQTAYHSSYGLLESYFGYFSKTEVEVREALDSLVKQRVDEEGNLTSGSSKVLIASEDNTSSDKIHKSASISYEGYQKSYISNEYSSLLFKVEASSAIKNSSVKSTQILTFRKLAPKIKNKL